MKVLLPKDEIRRRLTGEFATEVSDASGTLLLDVVNRRWSQAAARQARTRRRPAAHAATSRKKSPARSPPKPPSCSASPPHCKVVGGAGDCAAGAVGNGIVKPGLLATSIGTSGVVFVHSDQPQFDPQGRLHTFCHAVRGKWHMMGVILSAGGSLQWFQDAFCSTPTKSGGRKATVTLRRSSPHEAAATPAGAEGLYFLPYLAGERTPHLDPHARGALIGLTLAHGRGHVVRAIMEGVTYALRDSLAIIEGARRAGEANPRQRRRREEPLLAADAGRRVRQSRRRDGRRRRRRPTAWPCSPRSAPATTRTSAKPAPPPSAPPTA